MSRKLLTFDFTITKLLNYQILSSLCHSVYNKDGVVKTKEDECVSGFEEAPFCSFGQFFLPHKIKDSRFR